MLTDLESEITGSCTTNSLTKKSLSSRSRDERQCISSQCGSIGAHTQIMVHIQLLARKTAHKKVGFDDQISDQVNS